MPAVWPDPESKHRHWPPWLWGRAQCCLLENPLDFSMICTCPEGGTLSRASLPLGARDLESDIDLVTNHVYGVGRSRTDLNLRFDGVYWLSKCLYRHRAAGAGLLLLLLQSRAGIALQSICLPNPAILAHDLGLLQGRPQVSEAVVARGDIKDV